MSANMKTCITCKNRDDYGICNSPKLRENYYEKASETEDCLVYSYQEDGAFWVGPMFGCVHHILRTEPDQENGQV